MLPNWTDGLQTFGKWLEYFQMAEMHWLLFPCKKKKNCKLREWMRFGPSPIHIRVLCSSHCSGGNVLKVHLCVSDRLTFFLSKWGPGTQKGNSISQPAVSLHSQPTTTWSLPALWSFSLRVSHSCCCHVRICLSWVCWAWYFLQTWAFLVWCLLYSWQVMQGIVSVKDTCRCFTGLMW